MVTKLFFAEVPGVRVDRVWREGPTLHVAATLTRRAARCPLCRRRSKRVHSHYERTLADLPCCADRVFLHLHTRRFVCRMRWCRRTIFTERLPALMAPSARRTVRLRTRLERTGFDLGGMPGARHATADGMPVSPRTLLRLVRAAPVPNPGPVRVVGVDDWARRKGRSYGTIVVNLETHRVIDLLPDRTAATVAAWLRQHPEVEIVSRDRAGAYADAARQGAPQARQVADRFHLLANVTDALERYLGRKQAVLRRAAQALVAADDTVEATAAPAEVPPVPRRRAEREQHDRRERRCARYQEVQALRSQGYSIRAIAAQTGLAKGTVQRFVRAEAFPERQPRPPRPSLLQPFVSYLRARWDAGCHTAQQLWQEIRQQGFSGGRSIVADYLRAWRTAPLHQQGERRPGTARPALAAPTYYSARQTCWLLLRPAEALTTAEQAYLTQLYQLCPQIVLAEALVEEFATVLREHDVPGLYSWLRGVEISGIADLRAVVRGMWLDRAAIEAAVTLPWSQGQVEGHVNRLKVIKRQAYGRCGFDLLRQRVLHRAS